MLFVIPRTSLYRGSLNRGSTVYEFHIFIRSSCVSLHKTLEHSEKVYCLNFLVGCRAPETTHETIKK